MWFENPGCCRFEPIMFLGPLQLGVKTYWEEALTIPDGNKTKP
jgi:hypothetical protein